MQTDSDQGNVVTGINVTPMVDITLVLLIIFMVTATFVSEQGLKVTLPKVTAQQKAPTPAITVILGAKGELKLMKKDTDLDGLRRQMEIEARLNPEVKVLIRADKSVTYDKLAAVLDAIKLGGVDKIAMAMDRK